MNKRIILTLSAYLLLSLIISYSKQSSSENNVVNKLKILSL